MSSRDAILDAVRRNQPALAPLPAASAFPHPEGDATALFALAVQAASGEVFDSIEDDVDAVIARRHPAAKLVAATVAGVAAANLDLNAVNDPHDLAGLDLFVCEAEFGVAENGAVWVNGSSLRHRAALFLAQHVLVVLDREQIVWTMHEAYARVDIVADGFGVFVAGPSKTADIEQSLVIGAHGPRSLCIVMRAPGHRRVSTSVA